MNDPLETVCRTVLAALAVGVGEAALLGAFAGIVIAVSRASATTRHVLWWLALAGSAALPFASVASSLARVEHRAPARAASPADVAVRLANAATPADARDASAAPAAIAARAIVRAVVAYPHAAEIAVAIWLGVAAVGFASLARGLVSLALVKRGALPLDDAVLRRLRRFRHGSRAGRAVSVRVSNDIDVPIAVGFRSPTILFPIRIVEDEALAEIADLDAIAMHEYAHLDRYDDWTNLAERLLVQAFWFDPIVRFFARRIALEREIACDDWVIAQTGRAHRYATSLWKLVEATILPTRTVFAPGALLDARQITVRIERLLDSRRNALPRVAPFGALATAIVAVAFVVVQSVRAPAIAIDDRALAAAALVETAAVPSPRPTASPVPAPRVATVHLHRVPTEATPDAIARAVATAVASTAHAVVTTTVSRRATGPDSYADEIGIDVARGVASATAHVAPAVARAVASAVSGASGRGCMGCDLHGADLRRHDLRDVTWEGVDLHDADLRDADLRGARLVGVDLHGARLDRADLRGAHLFGCNVSHAQLETADTRGAEFGGIGD
jgi:beta-lactamase regulating signal transducer with metallopeptidase domain